jgi:hypothetical protein
MPAETSSNRSSFEKAKDKRHRKIYHCSLPEGENWLGRELFQETTRRGTAEMKTASPVCTQAAQRFHRVGQLLLFSTGGEVLQKGLLLL